MEAQRRRAYGTSPREFVRNQLGKRSSSTCSFPVYIWKEIGSALRKQRSLVSPPLRLELQCEGRHPQRAGIAPPHAEGDELSGVTSDRETFVFISAPAGVVGGVPLTRARNPWAMPEAST